MVDVTLRGLFLTVTLVTLLMAFKFLATNMVWAFSKGKAGQRAPEDPNQNSSPSAEDIEKSARFGRIIQNDLENIPLGLILLWAATVTYIISAGSNPQIKEYAQAIMAFAIIFAVARLLHTIVYGIAGPQPIRGALFLTGQLSALALGIISVILASKIPMQSDIVDPPSS